MTYSVHYGDKKGVAAPISGYLLVQPFRFEDGALLREPDEALLVVQLHLKRSEKLTYPSWTNALPLAGDYDIKDSIGNTPVAVTGFRTETIYSSQSFDLATTTWVLTGTVGSSITFSPRTHKAKSTDDDANHHPWRGTFDAGDGHKLQLSYLDYSYSLASGRRTATQLFASGPANAAGGGTVFSFVTGGSLQQPLTTATVIDPHRNTNLTVFGTSEASVAQMQTASGMVFALNGSFKRATPSSLRSLLNAISPRALVGHPLWQAEPFEMLAQSIAATESRLDGKEPLDITDSANEFEVAGSEVEGIVLSGMNPLPDKTAPALL